MFDEFVKPQVPLESSDVRSTVHVMWPTYIETIPLTEDLGGWQPASFHEDLAAEAIKGWKAFQKRILPRLPEGHPAREKAEDNNAGALNHGFFHWQRMVYEAGGDIQEAMNIEPERPQLTPESPSSWPEMENLPAYQKLRRLVDKLSRRYLARTGMGEELANNINISIFNWVAVHGPGEFHDPHAHAGEYNVGVFYAQVGPRGGKLRFGDPRGHSPPYGKSHIISPKAGQLVLFPPWLNHMATVTAPEAEDGNDGEEPYRVIFSFNIGPAEGPLNPHDWWSDPTSGMRFTRQVPFNPRDHDL